jgi:hypothetical protein
VHRYLIGNYAMATTAAPVKVTTGAAVKTMLQVSNPATRQCQIIAWGYTLDAAPATTGTGMIELIETDAAATVTAHVASGVQPTDPNAPASLFTLGVNNTGFTATVEGGTAASRTFDGVLIAGVSNGAGPLQDRRVMPPSAPKLVAVSKFLRVRATFSAAVNMLCWVEVDQ